MIRLGIDTGGTYTDAVVIDTDGPTVLAKAKSLTTKENLSRGIGAAVGALPREVLDQVEHAALSTTLATNACVEGKGGRARLVIVGTTDEVLHRVDAQGTFGIPYSDVITTPFVGSYDGSDVEIPDWEALYQSNPQFFEEADSFGIASLYALNNGAVVEQSGARFLRERFGKIVVESTTVATEINVIGRGATALLNARLVPVIAEFLDAIDTVFEQQGLDVPISIVRSDGSLMSEELARLRPVETILSGPAASVIGAQALVDAQECLATAILDLEDRKAPLPKRKEEKDIIVEADQKLVYVNVWMPYHRSRVKETYTKKTLTIPVWLDILAKQNNINFSETLVHALKEKLGIG